VPIISAALANSS